MTTRHCYGCNAEVEFHDGACLLGHMPRATSPGGSMAQVRFEVEQAFAQAHAQVQTLVEPRIELSIDAPEVQVPPRVPRSLGPPLAPPPPPPPPIAANGSAYQRAWDRVEAGHGPSSDPITNFAPPSRIDWGPERSFSLLKLRGILSSKA